MPMPPDPCPRCHRDGVNTGYYGDDIPCVSCAVARIRELEDIVFNKTDCPCTIADKPCIPNCTCVRPHMSHGCRCCCSYGSEKQRKAMANYLVERLTRKEPDHA